MDPGRTYPGVPIFTQTCLGRMKKFLPPFLIFLFFPSLFSFAVPGGEKEPIAWQAWTKDLFQTAQKENRMVLLDLEAVWCHWCHVMADTTYKDPKVVELIQSRFIPVRVDQDAHPDLSLRYEEWGWPATIVFLPDGTEIVKRRGYIPPGPMASLLEAIIKDPTPGPSVLLDLEAAPAEKGLLAPEQTRILLDQHDSSYDEEFGGWGTVYKLIDPYHLEWAMMKAREGDKNEKQKAVRTLDEALHLLDREWGGFFQYSDQRNWKSPHYEKIMSIQSHYIRLYALAAALWKDPRYLEAARRTADFVIQFWTDAGGAFYTSQDADVDKDMPGKTFYKLTASERERLGRSPAIDKHIYSRENGWMIMSLAVLHDMSGDPKYLEPAIKAADWISSHRALDRGGFRHDEVDRAGPYLGDTLAMGQAYLALYASTGDRRWLGLSEEAAVFIGKTFQDKMSAGFMTALVSSEAQGVFRKPVKQIEENVQLVRWANLLYHYTGKTRYRDMADHAMKYLASPAFIENRRFLAGVLVANEELSQEPAHLTIVGSKSDLEAKMLYQAALTYPSGYRRVEWWDRREGPLPRPDVNYPELDKSAGFLCANRSCSVPFFNPEKLLTAIDRRISK
jgi:hypothetical protein